MGQGFDDDDDEKLWGRAKRNMEFFFFQFVSSIEMVDLLADVGSLGETGKANNVQVRISLSALMRRKDLRVWCSHYLPNRLQISYRWCWTLQKSIDVCLCTSLKCLSVGTGFCGDGWTGVLWLVGWDELNSKMKIKTAKGFL